MHKIKVVEKKNPLGVHFLTYSVDRAQWWIDTYGDSKMFTDKTLTRDSFEIVKPVGGAS